MSPADVDAPPIPPVRVEHLLERLTKTGRASAAVSYQGGTVEVSRACVVLGPSDASDLAAYVRWLREQVPA